MSSMRLSLAVMAMLAILFEAGLAALSLSSRAVLAEDLPGRPEPGLPPRPPTPAAPAEAPASSDQPAEGAYLVLRVRPAYAVYWTTVEWQDGAGGWHTVDNWTGHTRDGGLRWFAAKELLGKGPFRWNVFTPHGGCLLVPGVPFMLPGQRGATVVTTVTLYPDCTWAASTNYLFD